MFRLSPFSAATKMYAQLALVAAVALFCLYQYLALGAAEKRALAAQEARAQAIAQAAVLAKTLEDQNAAVSALKSKLASKAAAVRQAEADAGRIARDAAKRLEQLRAEKVPQGCPAAVEWLGEKLRAGQ